MHTVERVICEMIIMRFYACRYINSYTHLNVYDWQSVCVCALCALTVSIRAFTFHFHACLSISFFLFSFSFSRFVKWIAVNLSYSSWRFAIYIKQTANKAIASLKTHSISIIIKYDMKTRPASCILWVHTLHTVHRDSE